MIKFYQKNDENDDEDELDDAGFGFWFHRWEFLIQGNENWTI
jgi:hypothetical protein